mmetsp:Transcript_236/g.1019  ORF Transcript_236/g.1019 Transcript_236/m.1019 type:complete len:250 (+) Transcript_236:3-752(+)
MTRVSPRTRAEGGTSVGFPFFEVFNVRVGAANDERGGQTCRTALRTSESRRRQQHAKTASAVIAAMNSSTVVNTSPPVAYPRSAPAIFASESNTHQLFAAPTRGSPNCALPRILESSGPPIVTRADLSRSPPPPPISDVTDARPSLTKPPSFLPTFAPPAASVSSTSGPPLTSSLGLGWIFARPSATTRPSGAIFQSPASSWFFSRPGERVSSAPTVSTYVSLKQWCRSSWNAFSYLVTPEFVRHRCLQ